MKLEGNIFGAKVYSDPNVPKGQIFIFNGVDPLARIDCRSRWQRFKDFLNLPRGPVK